MSGAEEIQNAPRFPAEIHHKNDKGREGGKTLAPFR
jgi:hypothetical protein